MNRADRLAVLTVIALTCLCACAAPGEGPEVAPAEGPDLAPIATPPIGVYAVWHGTRQDVFRSPAVVGGQVWAQWEQVEPAPGRYDFSLLDQRLDAIRERGRVATVQLNANRHPGWLFDRVPYLPLRLRTVQSERGTPMYWHPTYVAAQLNLLDALAEWIEGHPHREAIAGVRLSFNAVGTEGLAIPKDYQRADGWERPAGVAPGSDWSSAVAVSYAQTIVERYIERLAPVSFLLVRRSLFQDAEDRLGGSDAGARLRSRLEPLLDAQRAGIFHTSSEIQPRNTGYSREVYRTMRAECRERRRLCYAEAITTAANRRTEYPTTAPPTAGQWFYWRVLSDLTLGVSRLAVNRLDLLREDAAGFERGLAFADRYLGAHLTPESAPGAWIAFRSGDYLAGDYGVFAHAAGCGERRTGVGPANQPYGLWASHLEAGTTRCTISFDRAFLGDARPGSLSLHVTVRGATGTSPTLGIAGMGLTQGQQVTLPEDGRWHRFRLDLPGPSSGDARPADLQLEALGGNVDLHLVELRRAGTAVLDSTMR